MSFKPFHDDGYSEQIGNTTLENSVDHVSLYGSTDIRADQAGLQTAKLLRDRLDSIVKALEQRQPLPELLAKAAPTEIVANPFA